MTDFSGVPGLLWIIVMVAGLWPGAEPTHALDRPKKGYWTVSTVFWPIRKAYNDLWPYHAVLEKALRSNWAIALWIALIVTTIVDLVHLVRISPGWIMIEVAAVAFFLGRASGFWSADRKII